MFQLFHGNHIINEKMLQLFIAAVAAVMILFMFFGMCALMDRHM
jgi:hypothetical protein